MGRGSPPCAKLCERIVSQFKDNVSQRKIAPSTVHNIVKTFRESGEILVRKGQGQKPLLNACDHRALRRYCLRNCQATIMDIATWALENHCHSTQSAAASRNATWNCIMQRERHLLILLRNAAEFSGPQFCADPSRISKRGSQPNLKTWIPAESQNVDPSRISKRGSQPNLRTWIPAESQNVGRSETAAAGFSGSPQLFVWLGNPALWRGPQMLCESLLLGFSEFVCWFSCISFYPRIKKTARKLSKKKGLQSFEVFLFEFRPKPFSGCLCGNVCSLQQQKN